MAPTDREMLQEILRRLGRIEQRLGLTEFKSDIGGPGAREYPTQSSQRPVEPVVSSSPDQPRRIPSDGPLPELLDPDKGKSGGLPKGAAESQ
jgi:hypothetical protein